MSKEKLNSLHRYLEDMKSKLSSALPERHKGHQETYHNFLKNEIRMTSNTIEAAILDVPKVTK